MSKVDCVVDVSWVNLLRMYDGRVGGFFFNIDERDRVNGGKFLRYNARVLDLLVDSGCKDLLEPTRTYLTGDSSWIRGACVGDVGLLITALDKYGDVGCFRDLLVKRVHEESMRRLKRLVPDRVLWVLESQDFPELRSYVLKERMLRHSFFGLDYVCVSAVLYAIHYLVVKGFHEEAMWWYRYLVDRFYLPSGEWLLSYFPSLNWTYRKAFSVHQLGMGPLYLLELYEAVHEESILDVVKASVGFGLRFLNGDRVYRNLLNRETRCYECAFDIKGLMKAKEYGVA